MTSAREAATVLPTGGELNGLPAMLSNPKLALRLLDRNGDGRVTREDIQVLLKQLGLESNAARVLSKYLFQQLDTDGDGVIGEAELASASQLVGGLLNTRIRQRPAAAAAARR